MEKVTIGITTYNLERFIGQALDSILCQKTSFPYSVLVVDDASTDSTCEILRQYESKFPDRVKVIYLKENGGSLHASNILFSHIRSEYFSFLDGDDYWLTETRLQRQVEYLDAHPDHMMCGGNTLYLRDGHFSDCVINTDMVGRSYTFDQHLAYAAPFVHTSSILVRNEIYRTGVPSDYFENENTMFNCAYRGEDMRYITHLQKGPIFVMPDVLSVYRIHDKGIWQGKSIFHRSVESAINSLKISEVIGRPMHDCQYFQRQFLASYRLMLDELAKGLPNNSIAMRLFIELMSEMDKRRGEWNFLRESPSLNNNLPTIRASLKSLIGAIVRRAKRTYVAFWK